MTPYKLGEKLAQEATAQEQTHHQYIIINVSIIIIIIILFQLFNCSHLNPWVEFLLLSFQFSSLFHWG